MTDALDHLYDAREETTEYALYLDAVIEVVELLSQLRRGVHPSGPEKLAFQVEVVDERMRWNVRVVNPHIS